MSEWQFAAREGYLTWASPALGSGGQELYSVLSPTLLMGYQQEGDPLPLDFIKLSQVSSVQVSGSKLDVNRKDGMGTLLVAQNAQDAQEWKRNIDLALSNNSGINTSTQAINQSRATQQASSRGASNEASTTGGAGGGKGWSSSAYEQYSNLMTENPASATDVDRQSPRRQNREPGIGEEDPYHQSNNAPSPAVEARQQPVNLGSTMPAQGQSPPPMNLGMKQQMNESQERPHWGSPQVQKPTSQQQGSGGAHEHDFQPVSHFTQGGGPVKASTTTSTQHNEYRYENPAVAAAETSFGAGGRASGSRPLPADYSAIPQNQGGQSMTPNNAGMGGGHNISVSSFQQGGNSGMRRRMMVDVPASQSYNRNLVPNESAVWKQWKDPNGDLYVFHEPTQTLQRLMPNGVDFETMVEGTHVISDQDMAQRPSFTGNETVIDVDQKVVRNVENYGHGSYPGSARSTGMLDNGLENRGQYSPSRRAKQEVFAASGNRYQGGYSGRRVHKLVLDGTSVNSSVEHQVQSLESSGLMWNPKTGTAFSADGSSRGEIGMSTLEKQWNHVRKVLLQGRYFKKHNRRTTQSSFRYMFLTSDNAYVVCVPTSDVLLNVSDKDSQEFGSIAETIQYYGSESRAIALNTVTHVSLGTEEEFVRRRTGLTPENVFCIVSKTHAFVLECNTHEEAKYFCDAWTFFLYHSKPLNPKKLRTPQQVAPVTFGTRGGIRY